MTDLIYGSDLVVELLEHAGVELVAFNPGASFRGIHDSLAHRGAPRVVLCNQEAIAVAVAHGYAKMAGRPMAVAIHNIVGLQQASMAIFNAWCDRAPVLLLGGTGPLAINDRRPWIDWIHTAMVQAEQVRHYVKWDDQPADHGSFAESFARGWTTAVADPPGPVYLCYDASLQEAELSRQPALPGAASLTPPRDPAPDPTVLDEVAHRLRTARLPVLVSDYAGATDEGFHLLVRLAEALHAPVIDRGARLCFPSTHELAFRPLPDVLAEADVVLGIDVEDLYGALRGQVVDDAEEVLRVHPDVFLAHLTPQLYKQRAWSSDHQRQVPCDLVAAGSALPTLRGLVERVEASGVEPAVLDLRRAAVGDRVATARAGWRSAARVAHDGERVPLERLVVALGDAIEGLDWVLATTTDAGTEHRLIDFTRPRQHVGWHGGGGLGYSMGASIGIALASEPGTITVNLQADGDLLFTPAALWTMANERLPILTVVNNNRQYGNTVGHGGRIAAARGRDPAARYVGTLLRDPDVDFATLARSFGVWARGPVTDADELAGVLAEAIAVVRAGEPALVDVITVGG